MSYTRVTWEDGQTALSAEHMNNIEDGIGEALSQSQGNTDMWEYIRNLVYPVGSVYMTASLDTAAKVQAALGGTWVAWGQGRVPVGVDTSQTEFETVEKTDGEKTVTLTENTMPSHAHTGPSHTHTVKNVKTTAISTSKTSLPYGSSTGSKSVLTNFTQSLTYGNVTSESAGTGNTGSKGGGQAHNNLQPYITCYMWKRIA